MMLLHTEKQLAVAIRFYNEQNNKCVFWREKNACLKSQVNLRHVGLLYTIT